MFSPSFPFPFIFFFLHSLLSSFFYSPFKISFTPLLDCHCCNYCYNWILHLGRR
ncbi:hypothetical protein MANES_01G066150v8 [Manihot esculenta]|uniref:Uncharacterized protein n=1 Tax=Manihot esculenta TaxID=3983 RepID=A0ACB7IDL9_MANES|nr:hypothetical protein MANES_01G066150v8 [Manihot esculenta]